MELCVTRNVFDSDRFIVILFEFQILDASPHPGFADATLLDRPEAINVPDGLGSLVEGRLEVAIWNSRSICRLVKKRFAPGVPCYVMYLGTYIFEYAYQQVIDDI